MVLFSQSTLDCCVSFGRLGSSNGASTAGRRGAARCGAGREVLFCVCYIIRLGKVGSMFHGHVELLVQSSSMLHAVLITPLGWGDRGKVLLRSKQETQSHFFHGYESLNSFKPL